jgi:hypothetical protein
VIAKLVADAHGRVTARRNSSPQEEFMSIRIATSTTPMAQHKAPIIVGIAGLLASVLTTNIADAATSSHYAKSRASMPERRSIPGRGKKKACRVHDRPLSAA